MEVSPAYKQTEIGLIPKDWEVRPLSRVADIRGGIAKNANTTILDPISVHYLRVANVQDGFLSLGEMSKIELSRGDLVRYKVLPGDVLMNEGGDLDKLGRGAIWRGEFDPCVHQNHVFVVRCNADLLPEYLNIWTATSPVRRFFLVAGKQTTNLASISKSSLGELPVALPSLTEQRAIAAALGEVDALLAGLDRLIAKKRDLKQAAMQQLLTGQTRLPGFQGEWEMKQLGDVAAFHKGRGLPKSALTPYGAEPCIHYGELFTRYQETIETICSRTDDGAGAFRSVANDVLMPTSDVTPRGLAKASCVQLEGVILGGDILVIRCDSKLVFGSFLSYTIRNQENQILQLVTGTTVFHLYGRDMAKLTLSLPAVEEQIAIVAVLTDLHAELTALEARRDKTRALKQAMMQELLTGKTRLV